MGALYLDITTTLSGNSYLVIGTINTPSAVILPEPKWRNATSLEIPLGYL
jgi:hypothetical protein